MPRPRPQSRSQLEEYLSQIPTEKMTQTRTEKAAILPMPENGHGEHRRTMSSYIQVAKPYIFQQRVEESLKDVGVAQTREDNLRLAGVQWIDNVRRALKLPVRTFDTAVVYYHKFRLVHSDGEYSFVDAAAAALFTACKIEDTLKKSRDILCAAHNLKLARSEHLSPDDSVFEQPSRTIIGLERLMLEASGFDFRNRHPQHLMIKLAKHYGLSKHSAVLKTAYGISLDLYRTSAPLKQATATLAFASLELAGRVLGKNNRDIEDGRDYARWGVSRAMVMETLLDLLELYTHYRTSTIVGPDFALDVFLEVRIPLNKELDAAHAPRFTEYLDIRPSPTSHPNQNGTGNRANGTGTHAGSRPNGQHGPGPGGSAKNTVSPRDVTSPSTNSSLGSASTAATSVAGVAAANANTARQRAIERGREGTVRFMLNPDRERQERIIVAEYEAVRSPA